MNRRTAGEAAIIAGGAVGSGVASGGTTKRCSPRKAQGRPAGDQQRQARARCQQLGQQRGRRQQVLEVVQQQQDLPLTEIVQQQLTSTFSTALG
jgi:hypothetical protein